MDVGDGLIFVSIAAYRDPQLIPTVEDLIAKAFNPERLRFGICWQHGDDEATLPFNGESFRILDVDWRASRGACWARAEIMKLACGEEWFLQVDSHCRFAPGWDEKLIGMAKQTGSERPIVSTYGSAFTPGEGEVLDGAPLLIACEGFTHDGIPELKPVAAGDGASRSGPVGEPVSGLIRARFLGAGFLFTCGRFVQEVPYDPELYFHGEEAAMTVRAFTSGYDLFHPSETIVWHDYVRANGTRHWDNHTGEDDDARNWTAMDARSRIKVRRLLTGRSVESCGLGSARTLKEYEDYAGINFRQRKIEGYTARSLEPPNPEADPHWADKIHLWMARITLDFLSLPAGSLGDPSHWFVGIRDERNSEIYGRNFPETELETLSGTEDKIILVCEFQSGSIPATWVVQPVSRSVGRLERMEGRFAEGDYAIVVEEEADEDG